MLLSFWRGGRSASLANGQKCRRFTFLIVPKRELNRKCLLSRAGMLQTANDETLVDDKLARSSEGLSNGIDKASLRQKQVSE